MINFYALLSRMKYIERWSLMRNTNAENLSEHSYDVAVLAHALALLDHRLAAGGDGGAAGGARKDQVQDNSPEGELCGVSRSDTPVDAGVCVLLALYHDVPEIFTGDLPTPVKYANPAIREAVRQVEETAAGRVLSLLPSGLREQYAPLLAGEGWPRERELVKAADKLAALIKCVEEAKQGNREFDAARRTIEAELRAKRLPAVDAFMDECLPAYELPLDDLTARN